MDTPIPIVILAGSDQRAGPIPPGLRSEDILTGYKGALSVPWGGCLAGELVSRLRQSQRFADPILVGPTSVYSGLVDCEIVDVEGSLLVTLSRVVRLLQERFAADQPVAITTCDILPMPGELRDLLQSGYDPHVDCQFWWQIVAAEPGRLGASAWKPRYPAPGFCDEVQYCYFASGLSDSRAEMDQDEVIEPERMSVEAADAHCGAGVTDTGREHLRCFARNFRCPDRDHRADEAKRQRLSRRYAARSGPRTDSCGSRHCSHTSGRFYWTLPALPITRQTIVWRHSPG
jgi:hypothetical protein